MRAQHRLQQADPTLCSFIHSDVQKACRRPDNLCSADPAFKFGSVCYIPNLFSFRKALITRTFTLPLHEALNCSEPFGVACRHQPQAHRPTPGPRAAAQALHPPYASFGLGRTNNYMENLFAGSTQHNHAALPPARDGQLDQPRHARCRRVAQWALPAAGAVDSVGGNGGGRVDRACRCCACAAFE
ncbi:hypothetical protein FA95DRAFT_171501 [Auriscalpium vulgare]|uniref:Uncharacterized protein n=1 Tax=Auriscalpium vulgare TaxID=40419 RepID=A0ACB8RNJ4_9AGAM|nr:hypothetical protein FA95DRAFT_171501 [Auriscalpium vulgare]